MSNAVIFVRDLKLKMSYPNCLVFARSKIINFNSFSVNGLAGTGGHPVQFVWDLILIFVTLKLIQVRTAHICVCRYRALHNK